MLPIPQSKTIDGLFEWARKLMSELDRKLSSSSVTGVPTGTMLPFAGSVAPAGWTICIGQLLSKTNSSALYEAIGDGWATGGEPAGQFRLPDGRGKVFRGAIAGDYLYGRTGTAIITGTLMNNELNVMRGNWIIKL